MNKLTSVGHNWKVFKGLILTPVFRRKSVVSNSKFCAFVQTIFVRINSSKLWSTIARNLVQSIAVDMRCELVPFYSWELWLFDWNTWIFNRHNWSKFDVIFASWIVSICEIHFVKFAHEMGYAFMRIILTKLKSCLVMFGQFL